MESTQELLIAYQRTEILTNQLNVIHRNDYKDLVDAVYKKCSGDTYCVNVTAQKVWRDHAKDSFEISSVQAKANCDDDKVHDSNDLQTAISTACSTSSSNPPAP